MKAQQKIMARIMVLVVGMVLCGLPEYVQAQQQQTTPQQSQQNGTTIDPSKGPLQPVPTQNQPTTETLLRRIRRAPPKPLPATPQPQMKAAPQMQEPLGTATAEGVPTVGGAASRPAGEAIAPAKQNQKHSLLIKVGIDRCRRCRWWHRVRADQRNVQQAVNR